MCVCVRACMHTCVWEVSVCVCERARACTCVCMGGKCVCVHAHAHVCVCMGGKCVCVLCVCVCVCVCVWEASWGGSQLPGSVLKVLSVSVCVGDPRVRLCVCVFV